MDDGVRALVAMVAAGAAEDAGGIDPELLGDFLPNVVKAAASGRGLRPKELRACGERGAAAASAGVALRAVIDLYLSACWRLWEQLAQTPGSGVSGGADEVRAAGLAVLRAADDAAAALAEGFQLARNDLTRQQESVRREVFDALLSGGEQAAAVTGRAADLGLDLTSPHAVLVAWHPRTFDDPSTTSVPRRLERALQGRHGDAYPLVAVRNTRLVCVFAAPDADSVALVGRALTAVLAETTPGATGQAAVGRALVGAESVRVSHEQAVSALDLAGRLGLTAPVVDAAD
ncbi:MAG: PucR family transcriptional regulator, partial [Mycobacteriaceae bacterium]